MVCQYLCGSEGSPLVCWHVTVDIELHIVFLQHNGLVHSREHRTFELHTSQPICPTWYVHYIREHFEVQ